MDYKVEVREKCINFLLGKRIEMVNHDNYKPIANRNLRITRDNESSVLCMYNETEKIVINPMLICKYLINGRNNINEDLREEAINYFTEDDKNFMLSIGDEEIKQHEEKLSKLKVKIELTN